MPLLEETIDISPEQIEAFHREGNTLIKGVLRPEEVNTYREAINDAAYKYNTEKRTMQERDTYGKAFLQIMNLWELDENVKKFTLAKRFAKIAADLLGVENVRIYHD